MSQVIADNLIPSASGYDLGASPSQEWDVFAQTLAVSGATTLSGAVTFGAAVSGITSLTLSGQLTSTVATGTAPFVVASTTKVASLNADLLDGLDWTAPGTIGGVTPGAASFTTISASGVITSTVSTGTAPLIIASVTKCTNLNADLLDGGDWAAPGALGSTTPAAAALTTLTLTAAAPTVAASQVGFGSTVAATASNGTGEAVKANVEGYIVINVAGATGKVAYYKP
jgi:hypothetical protein